MFYTVFDENKPLRFPKVVCNVTAERLDFSFMAPKKDVSLPMGGDSILAPAQVDEPEATVPEFSDDELETVMSGSVTLEDIRTARNISDGCLFVVDIDEQKLTIDPSYNYTAMSLAGRQDYRQRDVHGKISLFAIYVHYAEEDFTGFDIVFYHARGTKVVVNVESEALPFHRLTQYTNIGDFLYPLYLEAEGEGQVQAGGETSLTLAVRDREGNVWDYPMDVYLESNTGYLPYRRVRVTGTASFPVQALGLKAGDVIRVKAGYRWYANLVHKDITVI